MSEGFQPGDRVGYSSAALACGQQRILKWDAMHARGTVVAVRSRLVGISQAQWVYVRWDQTATKAASGTCTGMVATGLQRS